MNIYFRLLSAPVPTPGKSRVELEILDKRVGPSIVFALPEPNRYILYTDRGKNIQTKSQINRGTDKQTDIHI